MTSEIEREELIAQLRAAGVKHNPDNILRIARLSDGRIVFLEIGDYRSGWVHIRETHARDFINRGISENQIIEAVMAAVTMGRFLGTQGTTRAIYEVEFNGDTRYISVDIASNGYIVGANPTKTRLIRRLIQEK
ncbi:MAG TPA: hypothetical protein VK211_03355 [Kamptonema sp.]|nr:hypothetical protein [Kamptonema sp.]